MKIDFAALADHALSTFDYDANYEEDCFCITFQGERIYCERHSAHFKFVIAEQVVELPRI